MRLAVLGLLICMAVSAAEIIPFDRRVFRNFTLPATAAEIQSALLACPGNHVVQLGAWTNAISGSIDWQGVKPGVVLRGTTNRLGQPMTQLRFSSGFIYMRSIFDEGALSRSVNIAATVRKGDIVIFLGSVPSWIRTGHIYILDQLDDPSFVSDATGREGSGCYRMRTGNGRRGLGQMIKVAAITLTNITTELPLHFPWSADLTAQIAQAGYNPVSTTPRYQCGIEDLRLEQTFANSDTHMIRMENCDNCWIRNVESYNVAGLDHVFMEFSYRCEVRDSHFRKSHFYGPGQGYGVALYDVSCACLIENNIFEQLHVAMQSNYGSSGNAFVYNYAFGGMSDVNESPSISTHGHHASMNLFEGNYCAQKAMFDCIHGSGSHNTLFRNRLAGFEPGKRLNQCAVDIDYFNRKYNAVGNLLGTSDEHSLYEKKAPSDTCSDTDKVIWKFGYVNAWSCRTSTGFDSFETLNLLRALNYDTVTKTNGGVVNNGYELRDLPKSCVYLSRPAGFGSLPWPPFDPANPSAASLTNIPAGYRYTFGTNPPPAITNHSQ